MMWSWVIVAGWEVISGRRGLLAGRIGVGGQMDMGGQEWLNEGVVRGRWSEAAARGRV